MEPAFVVVNANTGALRLCAIFDNPGNILRPGQYGRVRSVMRIVKDAIVIPQRAVNELQGIQQVAVVTADNKASIRTVKAGPQVGSGWLIEEGLKAGDKVEVREASRALKLIVASLAQVEKRPMMSWIELDKNNFVGTFKGKPVREEMNEPPIREQYVVEYYSR